MKKKNLKTQYIVHNVEELIKLAKREKTPRFRDRLKALLLLSRGVNVKHICSVFNVNEKSLKYRWLARWNRGGYDALIDNHRPGRNPLIPHKYRKELREYVLSQDKQIICKDLVPYVKEKWDIDCNDETVRKVLKSMKLSWQKPDKVNHKANEKEKKVFLKGASWC